MGSVYMCHFEPSREEHDLIQNPPMGRCRYIWVSNVNYENSEKFGEGTAVKNELPISPVYKGLDHQYFECVNTSLIT